MDEIIAISANIIDVGEHEQRFEEDDDSIADLAGSIRRVGLIEPLCVTAVGDRYVLVFGHRRFAACKRIGMGRIPCLVARGDEVSRREMTFAENFFRRDLTAIELAVSMADQVKEERMTVEQLAAGFRRSTDWVRRQLAICGWPEDVLEAVHSGGVSIAAASNLALVDEDEYRCFLVRKAVEGGATAQTTALWLQGWRATAPGRAMQAVEDEDGEQPILPAAPLGPCLCCSEVFRVDAMSHVPLCPGCIRVIREGARTSAGRAGRGPRGESDLCPTL